MLGGVIKYSKSLRRNVIKTEQGWIPYAVFVAMNNPDICGKWFPGCEVHHIDGNRINDSPENLVCLTKDEHHKIHRGMYNKKRVSAYKNGIYLGTFDSMTQAAKELLLTESAISHYCRYNAPVSSTYKDYTFFIEDKLPKQLKLF